MPSTANITLHPGSLLTFSQPQHVTRLGIGCRAEDSGFGTITVVEHKVYCWRIETGDFAPRTNVVMVNWRRRLSEVGTSDWKKEQCWFSWLVFVLDSYMLLLRDQSIAGIAKRWQSNMVGSGAWTKSGFVIVQCVWRTGLKSTWCIRGAATCFFILRTDTNATCPKLGMMTASASRKNHPGYSSKMFPSSSRIP